MPVSTLAGSSVPGRMRTVITALQIAKENTIAASAMPSGAAAAVLHIVLIARSIMGIIVHQALTLALPLTVATPVLIAVIIKCVTSEQAASRV
jgi:hypothetical protein